MTAMAKKVLFILGHPSQESFCRALLDTYQKGAESSNAICKSIIISDLKFNINLSEGYKNREGMVLEEDIIHSQQLIKWADHVVMVYPTWWGSMPALTKGLLTEFFYQGLPSNIIKENLSPKSF